MAYLQTTATSTSDILNTIATFATGLGWTVSRNNTFTSGANNRRILTLSRAGFDYTHFFDDLSSTTKTNIYVMRSIGVNLTGDFSAQTERSDYSQTNLLSGGPYVAMWLFGEGGSNPYIHVVIEHAAGRYRHFGIGNLIKKGVWTGGDYCYGTWWNQSFSPNFAQDATVNYNYKPFTASADAAAHNGGIRCNECDAGGHGISGVDQKYVPYWNYYPRRCDTGFVSDNNSTNFEYVSSGLGLATASTMLSVFNQRTNLIRLNHFVTSSGGYWRFIGEPPAIRACSVNTFEAGQEFVIGSDTWKIFPLVNKNLVSLVEYSAHYGLAYKKVV